MTSKFSDGMELSPDKGEGEAVLICNRRFRLRCFPKLFSEYLEKVVVKEDHYDLEERGRRLKDRIHSADISEVTGFVQCVCHWGGRDCIGKNILAGNNPHSKIVAALGGAVKAVEQTAEGRGGIATAIEQLELSLQGLGTSFASKHLRMLFPDKCVAYDSVLEGEFCSRYGDTYDYEGYARFCSDCVILA